MRTEEILEGLSPTQHHAVTHPAPTLAVEAGAGSGKTRVLTRRIAHRAATGEVDPHHVLAVTFTRRASGELISRLRGLGLRDSVTAGTFHSIAYAQLRTRWADRGVAAPSLIERKASFVARFLPEGADLAEVITEIEWAKARLVTPTQYPVVANAEGRRTAADATVVAEAYRRYETEKRRRRVVDFDDLLRLCCHELSDDREFAAAQHWRYRHLFVDEFQDINPLQFALLQAWLGARDDLFVVGDPNQAIYGWNGADAHHLSDLEDHYPHLERVLLDENHRSSPQVLAAAAAVLRGPGAGPVLRPTRPDGPAVEVLAYEDGTAEARGVARSLRDLHRPGGRWSWQAVLVRTHAQLVPLAEACRAAGIPVRLRGGRSLADDPEVRRLLRELAERGGPFVGMLADLEAETTQDLSPDEGTAGADATNPDDQSTPSPSLTAGVLVRLGHEYLDADPAPTLAGFEAWLRDSTGGDELPADADAVELCTFHAAKGLEWPIVHLAGLEQGLVPIAHARTPDLLEEERRLLYVAATRAEQQLRCTWARTRTFGTKSVRRQASPHLADIEATAPTGAPVSDEAGREAASAQRARLRAVPGGAGRPAADADGTQSRTGGLHPSEQAILRALQEWRAAAARAASVAPTAVLADRTLVEVARLRPRNRDELRAVRGIGPMKAARYGDALVHIVDQHRVGSRVG